MLFNSLDFWAFFCAVFLVQRWLPHRQRNLFLLACSYFFYACWDWRFLSLIVVSTLVDYIASRRIAENLGSRSSKCWLVASCAVNLGVLGFFKYADFGIESANALLHAIGFSASAWRLDLILPVGISFYTFQTMSYTIDVYRGDLQPLRRLDDFALYVAFFPQLVAGPIERGASLAPQMSRKHLANWQELQSGSWLCLKGLFKKSVIADNMAPIADSLFAGQSDLSGTLVLLGMYAFAFQIYGDFSGYSDMARGAARILGYELMVNFRLPYLATTPSDFWRRWHISLSSWLRDYLYIPLGGNRRGAFCTSRNLMATMVLGGLWHGAAWTFVLWGAYHGALLVLQRLLLPVASISSHTRLWLQRVVMFHLVVFGWLLFRADSMQQIAEFVTALLTRWTWTDELGRVAWQIGLLCGPLMANQIIQSETGDLNYVSRLSWLARTAVYVTVVLMLLTLGRFNGQAFIYFQF